MKVTLIILAVIFGLATIGMWIGWGVGSWLLDKDTTYVLARAQVAANASDMHDYMIQLQKNMEEREMTKGHAAWIFKTPENDMSLIYKTVVRVNERLAVIKDIPQSETTYQVALDDLRGTIRELNLHTGDWFSVYHWAWTRFGSWLTCVLTIILSLAAATTDQY